MISCYVAMYIVYVNKCVLLDICVHWLFINLRIISQRNFHAKGHQHITKDGKAREA